MNRLQVKGDWNVAKGKLKQYYAGIKEDEWGSEVGQKDERVGQAQRREGKAKENFSKALKRCHRQQREDIHEL